MTPSRTSPDIAAEHGGDLKAHLLYSINGRQVGLFVCDEPTEGALALKAAEAEVETATVLTVHMENRPGAFSHLARSLEFIAS